jgi:hypothetical protein
MIIDKKQNIFLFIFFGFALSYLSPYNSASTGVDPAWHESLIMFKDLGLPFGKDFVFTYGPLGYLNTRLFPKDFNIIWAIFLDAIYLLNLLAIIKLAFRKASYGWVIFFSLYIFLPWGVFADISFTYLYLIIFWILYSQSTKSTLGLWFSLFFTIISFFIKVNLSIIIIGVFEMSLLYFIYKKIIKWDFWLLQTVILLISIYFLSVYHHLDIVNYIRYSITLIDGYQDAMAVTILTKKELFAIILLEYISLLIFFRIFYIMRKSTKDLILMWLLFTCIYFLNFKQAHTAISKLNLYGFFLMIPLQGVLIYLFSPEEYKAKITKYIILIIFLQTFSIQFLRISESQYSFSNYCKNLPKFKYNPLSYFKEISEYNYETNFKNSELALPKRIKSIIGNNTVDILQSRIDYIYFNKLNYLPRPVIQSYSAYSPQLVQLNAQKFRSTLAPVFVLFQLDHFRQQNPFWSDSEVNLELLRKYDLIENFKVGKDSLLLFKKSNSIKNICVKKIHHKIVLNKKIIIPNRNIIQFFGHIQYSIGGKLARLFFQPPYLYCKVTYQDGEVQNFRVVNQILEAGVVINKKVTTHQELYDFYSSKGTLNKNVSHIVFYSKFDWGFTSN